MVMILWLDRLCSRWGHLAERSYYGWVKILWLDKAKRVVLACDQLKMMRCVALPVLGQGIWLKGHLVNGLVMIFWWKDWVWYLKALWFRPWGAGSASSLKMFLAVGLLWFIGISTNRYTLLAFKMQDLFAISFLLPSFLCLDMLDNANRNMKIQCVILKI